MEKPESTGIKRDEFGRFPKGVSGNPAGRPEGSISLLNDVKRSLLKLAKEKPEEYKALIDDYWEDKEKRKFLMEMIDGKPKQQTDLTSDGDKIQFIIGRNNDKDD